jgi:hypothetical protein
MNDYQERKKTIEELQQKRGTVIVTYFLLCDRGNVIPLFVGDDALRPMHRLLEDLGHKESIDLFIHTRGGNMMTAPTIVKMLREYSDKLNVLVPFRCHSAGTQIALGADNIVMSKIGQLSPIDPTTANLFNPLMGPQVNPADPRNRKPISVEDVQSYLNLSRDRVGLVSDRDRLEVFKELTKYIEPLALGNVNRVYSATRMIAKEMLSLHMNAKDDDDKIEQIIKALTETFPHDFMITRDTASKIGLKSVHATPDEEKLMMTLFASYEAEFKMNTPFDADDLLTRQSLQPPPQPGQALQPGPVGLPMQGISPQQPRPLNFKTKIGAIEGANDSFIHVVEGSVSSSFQGAMQMGVGPMIPIPGATVVNFKLGKWLKYSDLAGMNFE